MPPCKVGDTLYTIGIFGEGVFPVRYNSFLEDNNSDVLNALGRTIFLTREEAERALAERSEG